MELKSAQGLLELCAQTKTHIPDNVATYEAFRSNITVEQVREEMGRRLQVMRESVERGLQEGGQMAHLVKGYGLRIEEARKAGRLVGGAPMEKIIAYSLAVAQLNASLGRVVACPTGGSCGVVPGALLPVGEELGVDDEMLVDALLTAAGIGTITAAQGPISGAAGGCQAECGVASAMAAGAIVYLAGGSPEEVFDGAALALQNMLGLVCDPVAGLVEVPCVSRNASSAANAVVAANMVLAGIKSFVPYDQTVLAMKKIGDQMPESLRETSLGGLAATEAAQKIQRRLQEENKYI
ncbi:MAG: L-serine ammonia-lyase, iron-sulfur-dependent, subunit alpha [Limnochordia bacterium]|jgi:L-serine dehydratase